MPCPRTLSILSGWVPSGMMIFTEFSDIVGISFSVPTAASVKLIGTFMIRLSPSRENISCGFTDMYT